MSARHSELSSGANLPSIRLEDLPGTLEYAQKVFGNQDLTRHYDGEFARKFGADEFFDLKRQVGELNRMCLKLKDAVAKLYAHLGKKNNV